MTNFNEIESAIMGEMLNLTTYFKNEWQVSRDDSVLQRGADYFAIFKSGNVYNEQTLSTFDLQVDMTITFEVQTRFSKNIDETKQRHNELLAQIDTLLTSYAFLRKQSGVMETKHSRGNEIQYLYLENNPQPVFIMSVISVLVSTYAERENA